MGKLARNEQLNNGKTTRLKQPHRRYPRIEVIWEDHHSDEFDEWTEPSSAEELTPVLIQTSGYLVGESDSTIEISRDADHDQNDGSIGAPIRILKKCIVYRKED